jgi:DsbC/DsbD-like thiol-disulfide interchange protein
MPGPCRAPRFIFLVFAMAVVCGPITARALSQGGTENPKPPTRVAWTLALDSRTPADAGHVIRPVVTAKIDEGWHVYSLVQPRNGPAALFIAVPPGQPFTIAGALIESTPIVKIDAAFNNSRTQYFEKEATITVPLRIAAGTPPGPATLRLVVEYQVCSDTLCLPPGSVELKATVAITSGAHR